MTSRVLPFGDRAVLAECDTLEDVLALHARLAASRPDGVVDLVPAARTVLVHVDPGRLSLAAARAWIARLGTTPVARAADAPVVELPIVYDGPDIEDVALELGLSAADLAAQHATCEWTVAFTGFAPGFGYLVSDGWTHDVPRRASPRTRVPAGAVGIAAGFTGAYPRETPGGWQLIGTTSAPLFRPDASPPALLAPGTRVRFVPAPAGALGDRHAPPLPVTSETAPADDVAPGTAATPAPVLRIEAPGAFATVQDAGRVEHAAEGIAVSGAADRAALRRANRLVGNPEDAAVIEVALGGFRAVAQADLWVAITGAWGPMRLGGRQVDASAAHRWRRGDELELGAFDRGLRACIAVRGGLGGVADVGSRSTDTLSGLGPRPLRAGDVLTISDPRPTRPVPPEDLHPWNPPGGVIDVEVAPGPRADWFADPLALFETSWTVSPQADRVGIRLDGDPLVRSRDGELPSEGMLPGAIQVPPDGRPVILGPDGPVTGGYPVIGVVADASRDVLAQARPGTRIRFRHARLIG
ncbi:5-oxoprolinase subunit B/C family protein [Microbacterium dextranolyticum]|uniref:5-oxoprolinase subunit B/C family protein n=1 Tax=Microbacterium dextranolyticum TaxID=36806 RepID=UPI00195A8808|nr:urea amidolyase family protein [Microbacterium dextranolyticum]MBM7462005.1 KipI family sensor histidine kinase inhibitor [Microbacterium dextranolyticum]